MKTLLLFIGFIVLASAVIPEDFRIQELPYYTGELPEMYSGFLPVSPGANQTDPAGALFFWFIANNTKANAEDTPLIIWLNGGPGASSMIGFFTENGPFKVEVDPSSFDPKVVPNQYTWSSLGHMLFIDQPIGTGFSYAKDESVFVTSNQEGALHFRIFLTNFFSVFSEYKANPIYLNGGSYCGKYLPLMSKEILDHPEDKINLQALMLGNGLIDPITQRLAIPNLIQSLGFISFNQVSQVDHLQTQCKISYSQNKSEAINDCNKIPNYFYEVSGHVDMYNLQKYTDISTQPYEEYLSGNYATNISEILHVNSSPKSPVYSTHNSNVASALAAVFMDSAVQTYNQLLSEYRLPMLFYIGQFDGYDGITGQVEVLKLFNWDYRNAFDNRFLYITDTFKHAGYFIQVYNFTWAVISGAGHAAPQDQPQNTFKLISDYINSGKQLPMREESDSPQKAMCQLMSYCHGHGQCREYTGVCECDQYYLGQDCSEKINLGDQQFTSIELLPQEWYYFRAQYAQNYHTVIKSLNGVRFSVLGLDQDNNKLPSFQYYDIRELGVLLYTHYVKFYDNQETDYYDLIGIYNPFFTETASIQITYQQIFQKGQVQIINSFWAPPYPGFWIEVIIALVAVVSIIFNLILYKKYSLIQKRSYSLVDLKKSGRIDQISTVFVRNSIVDKRKLISSEVINT